MTTDTGATWLDLAREVFPDVSKEEADFLLWNKTAFPFAAPEHIRKQLLVQRDIVRESREMERLYSAMALGLSLREAAAECTVTQKTAREWRRRINEICRAHGLRPMREEVP